MEEATTELEDKRVEATKDAAKGFTDFLSNSSFMNRAREASKAVGEALEQNVDKEEGAGLFSIHTALDNLINQE